MRRMIFLLLLCLIVLVGLAACGAGAAPQVVSEAHAQSSTQIGSLRATATVQAARMRTTLDFVETRVGIAATRSQFLKSTLVYFGTPLDYLNRVQQQYVAAQAVTLADPLSTATAPASIITSAPNPAAPTLNAAPNATPTPDNAPRLVNPVMARGTGPDGCAVGLTNTFTNQSERIYVVARAFNVPAGTVLGSRWLLRNTEIVYHEFTAEEDFDDICVWFFIDETDTTLFVGTWDVILEMNGQPIGEPQAFTITPG